MASSPPLLILSLMAIFFLWRKLESREAKLDEISARAINSMNDVTSAVKSLTDEIRSNR